MNKTKLFSKFERPTEKDKGRITDVDVKAYVKRVLSSGGIATPGGSAWPRVPVVDFAAYGPIARKPLTRIQRI